MKSRDNIGILILEPSETYQRILTTLLNRLGYTSIHLTSNPLKAKILLQHNKGINVILAELMLPTPKGGVAFVKTVREWYSGVELPILMMTNLSEKSIVQEAIKAGISGYLIKPVDPDHLEAHLLRFFDLPLRGSQKMGEYLVSRRVITSEQRDLALKFQKEFTVSCSVLALNLGYVSVEALRDWDLFDDDSSFFENASKLELNAEQVDHLQALKAKNTLRLGDILVKFGFVDKQDLEEALVQFRRSSSAKKTSQL